MKSFVARFSKQFDRASSSRSNGRKAPASSRLALENLEARELLSITPTGILDALPDSVDSNPAFTASDLDDQVALSCEALLNAIDAAEAQNALDELVIVAPNATGATLTVTNINDSGTGSLRAQIAAAQNGDKIVFSSSLNGKTITLSSELEITDKSISIIAEDSNGTALNITINGNNSTRIFHIKKSGNDFPSVSLQGLNFKNGKSSSCGGGIYSERSNLTLTNCTISDCIASSSGGGLYASGTLVINKSQILRNESERGSGGGIYIDSNSSAIINQSSISDNWIDNGFAGAGGGGISASGKLIVNHSRITGNSADNSGGGIASFESLSLHQSLIAGNTSGLWGGGVYSHEGYVNIYSSTITANKAGYDNTRGTGGGLYAYGPYYSASVYNSIIVGNTSAEDSASPDVAGENGAQMRAYYTLSTYETWDRDVSCYVYNPNKQLFVNPGSGNYQIMSNSQAVNAGNNDFVSFDVDLAGKTRVVNGKVDLGAYEYLSSSTPSQLSSPRVVGKAEQNSVELSWEPVDNATGYQVVYDGSPQTLNASETSIAFSDLQKGKRHEFIVRAVGNGTSYINSSDVNFAIYTTGGSTTPMVVTSVGDSLEDKGSLRYLLSIAPNNATIKFDPTLDGKTITLNGSQLEIFEKSISIIAESPSGAALDITIDGNDMSRIFYIHSYSSSNGYTLTLKGLNVINGYASNWSSGVCAEYANINLLDCTVSYCNTYGSGGGVCVKSGVANLDRCLISENWGGSYVGGGIYVTGVAEINQCQITGNAARNHGGGIYVSGSSTISQCQITDNSVYQGGGGIYASGESIIDRCVISNNISRNVSIDYGYGGGGIYVAGTVKAHQTLIANNSSGSEGGGIYTKSNGTVELRSCTIAGNTADYGGGICFNGNASLYNSIVAKNYSNKSGAFDIRKNGGTIEAKNTLSSYTSWDQSTSNYPYSNQPLFVNVSSGNYSLSEDSCAIDKGNRSYLNGDNASYARDLAGNARIVGGQVDLGAYEYHASTTNPLTSPSISGSSTTTSITLTWSSVANASGYHVDFNGHSYDYSATTTRDTFNGLTPNTLYTFVVRAIGDGNNYSDSENVSFSISTKSNVPTPIQLTPRPELTLVGTTSNTITVSWESIPNASSYVLSYAVKATTPDYSEVNVGYAKTSYTIRNLQANTNYYIKIQAKGDGVNYADSQTSATLSVKTLAADLTQLATPTITSKSSTKNSITINWSAVSSAQSYAVIRSGQSTATTVDKSKTTYTFTGLAANTTYTVQVKAIGDHATTDDSAYASASVKTQADTTTPVQLDRPALTEISKTANSITVSWGTIAHASSYNLYYAVKATNPTYVKAASLGASKTSYTVSGLQPNTSYYLKIQAIGDGTNYTNSPYSPTITVKTLNPDLTQLATPTITSNSSTNNSATINWSAVSGATGYYVVCGNQNETLGSSARTWTFGGLSPNTTYTVQVKALGNNTTTSDSNYASVSIKTPGSTTPEQLTRPTLTEVSKTSTSITVRWETIANASSFNLYYAVKATNPTYVKAASLGASKTSWTISGLQPSTNYYVKIQAIGDGVNYSNSPYSPTLTVKTLDPTPVDPEQLARPTLTEYSKTANSITVKWGTIANASSYTLSYAVKATNPTYTPITGISASATSKTISGLQPNTNYYLKIQAIGDGVNYKNSANSPTITVKTLEQTNPDPVQLDRPALTEVSKTANSITVSWGTIAHASSYELYYAVKATNPTYVKAASLGSSKTSYTISSGIQPNTSYYVKIKAKGDNVNYTDSAFSPTLTVKTPAPTPTQLDRPALTTTATTSNSISVKWDAIPNASSYVLSYAVKATNPSYTTVPLAASSTSYKISGLQASTNYYVKIQAIGDGVYYTNSANSPTLTVKTPAPTPTQLDRPTLTATGTTDSSITVNWGKIANASSYNLYYAVKSSSPTYVKAASLGASKTSWTISNLQSNTNYYVKLQAIGDGVNYTNSAYSPTITVKTGSGGVETPSTIVTTLDDVVNQYDGKISLREAINYASDGATIRFNSALDGGTITLNGSQLEIAKSLTIAAETTSGSDLDITIDANNRSRVFYLKDGSNIHSVSLEGLRVTNGKTTDNSDYLLSYGAGIFSYNYYLTLIDCAVENCSSAGYGGGIYTWGRQATLTSCSISACEAAGRGGGVSTLYTDPTLSNCIISNCSSNYDGGGAYFEFSDTAILTNCTINGNVSNYGNGGGISTENSWITATNCNFVNCGANASGESYTDGGGIYAKSSHLTIEKSVFANCYAYDGGAVFATENSTLSFNACKISDCVALYGGGVFLNNGSDSDFNNCSVVKCDASLGGGLFVLSESGVRIYSSTIASNNADSYGGGLYVDVVNDGVTACAYLFNSIIASNSAGHSNAADVYKRTSSSEIFANNVLSTYNSWNSGGPNYVYNSTQPLFANAAGGNYALAANSQAIDKGNNNMSSSDVDLAGKTRIVNGTIDLGAYEYQGAATQLARPSLQVTSRTSNSITVSWGTIPNASSYNLYYAVKSSSPTYVKAASLGASKTSWTITGLQPNTSYYIKIQAIGDGVNYTNSPYSPTVTSSTPAANSNALLDSNVFEMEFECDDLEELLALNLLGED